MLPVFPTVQKSQENGRLQSLYEGLRDARKFTYLSLDFVCLKIVRRTFRTKYLRFTFNRSEILFDDDDAGENPVIIT